LLLDRSQAHAHRGIKIRIAHLGDRDLGGGLRGEVLRGRGGAVRLAVRVRGVRKTGSVGLLDRGAFRTAGGGGLAEEPFKPIGLPRGHTLQPNRSGGKPQKKEYFARRIVEVEWKRKVQRGRLKVECQGVP